MAFDNSFRIGNGEYNIGISIGISVIHGRDLTPDDLLKRADTAMYRTKKAGGNDFAFFDPELQRAIDLRLNLEKDIVESIKANHFCAHFQAQVDCNKKVIGAEALIRWIHPEKGFIPPNEFIPVAEQFGLIDALQQAVLKNSCELIKKLEAQNLIDDNFSVAVNISPIQFKKPQLKTELLKTLEEYDIPPKRIHLEITEGMLIDKVDFSIAQMNELRNIGFKFSIDDFGTGYSSLAYLHKLPIDELKIDKSFIDQVPDNQVGIAIVDTIIGMAQNMNFSVVAEGVEEQKQVELLNARNIKAIQGYVYARPMPEQDFIAWLSDRPNG